MFKINTKWLSMIALMPFFVASFATALGNGAEYVAGTWSAVAGSNHLNHELFRVMFYMFCFWLPTMTFGPIMGSLVDRFKRQHCYLGAAIAGVIITGGFALLFHYFTSPWLWPMLLIGMGFLFSMRFPAGNALAQELAKPEDLLLVNALAGITFELGNLIGNASGGWLVAYFSIPIVLAAVCACFVFASITACFLPEAKNKTVTEKQPSQSLRKLYLECFQCVSFLRHNKRAGILAILQMLVITCFMSNPVFLAPFVRDTLHQGASYFGLIETLISVSFIAASFMLGFMKRILGAENALISLLSLMLIAFTALLIHPSAHVGLLAYSMVGFGFSSWALSSTLLFENTPQAMQGRIQALISSATGLMLILLDAVVLPFVSHVSNMSHLFVVMLALIGMVLVALIVLKRTSENKPAEEATA